MDPMDIGRKAAKAVNQTTELSLDNICGGAVGELFNREVLEVLENIADINTDEKAKRVITLQFTFAPYKDRSGAEVECKVTSKTAPTDSVTGNVFFSKATGALKAYARDPRQDELFRQMPAPEA